MTMSVSSTFTAVGLVLSKSARIATGYHCLYQLKASTEELSSSVELTAVLISSDVLLTSSPVALNVPIERTGLRVG